MADIRDAAAVIAAPAAPHFCPCYKGRAARRHGFEENQFSGRTKSASSWAPIAGGGETLLPSTSTTSGER